MSDDEVATYLSQAKALLFPGIEDFGIIPVEANAAGCPVLAYKDGGALDSIKENVTGLFFDEQSAESLAECIKKFEACESKFLDRNAFTEHVKQFSNDEFVRKMKTVLEKKVRR